MSPFSVNFSGVEEQVGEKPVFEPLPDGQYSLIIEKVEEKNTRNGDPIVSIRYRVIEGSKTGRKFYENIVFADGILGRSKHFLHVIGQPYEDDSKITPAKWIDAKLKATVGMEEYDGKLKNNVKIHDFYQDENADLNIGDPDGF